MVAYINPIPTVDTIDINQDTTTPTEVNNNYIYQNDVFFAFIDVLGFKKTFDDVQIKCESDDEYQKIVGKYNNVFNYYFSLMSASTFNEKDYYAGQTSDSLYFYTQREEYLISFLKIFSHFNLYSMTQDVFFRGGIAKGNLFYNEKSYQFYGESVIRAYLMESGIAKNPTIVLDKATSESLKDFEEYDLLINTTASRPYLKPFASLTYDIDLDLNPEKIIKEIDQEKIFENIERNKRKFEYDDKNYSKYCFLDKEYQDAIKSIIGGSND